MSKEIEVLEDTSLEEIQDVTELAIDNVFLLAELTFMVGAKKVNEDLKVLKIKYESEESK